MLRLETETPRLPIEPQPSPPTPPDKKFQMEWCAEQATLAAHLAFIVAQNALGRLAFAQRPRKGGRPTARQAGIWLLRSAFRLRFSHLGRLVGRDRTTVRYDCRRVGTELDPILQDGATRYLTPSLRTWLLAFSARSDREPR